MNMHVPRPFIVVKGLVFRLKGHLQTIFHYNVIVTFRGEGVEHVTFWFGTIGLGMSLGLFGLENEARVR